MSPKFTTIVLTPAGPAGLIHIGAFQYLMDSRHLAVENIVGISSGSIIAYLFCLGIFPHAMFDLYVNKICKVFSNNKINIKSAIANIGLKNSSVIRDILVEITLQQCGDLFTFKSLHEHSGIHMMISAYNCTKNMNERFSHTHTPDMDVIQAVCMSSCIPLYFEPIVYNGCKYTDGVIGTIYDMEYPVDILGIKDGSIVGIHHKTPLLPSNTLIDMVLMIITTRFSNEFDIIRKAYSEYHTLIHIDDGDGLDGIEHFRRYDVDKMNQAQLYGIFKYGYTFAKNEITKILLSKKCQRQ